MPPSSAGVRTTIILRVTWVSNSLVTYHAWKAFPILGGLFFLTLHIMVVKPLVCYPPKSPSCEGDLVVTLRLHPQSLSD